MAHNSQITAFNAPLRDAVGPFIPFNMYTPMIKTLGIIFGDRLFGPREQFNWDTLGLMKDDVIYRPSIRVHGDVGEAAKSAFLKIYAYECGAILNNGRKSHIYVENLRWLNGEPEYTRLAAMFKSEIVGLAGKKINLFADDLNLTMSHHLETAVSVYESSNNGASPVRHEKLSMRVALHEMFQKNGYQGRKPGMETFAEILLALTKTEATRYIEQTIQVASTADSPGSTHEATPEDELLEVSLKKEDYDTSNIDWDEFCKDAGHVASAVLNFLDGEYGDIFGGTDSFADDFKQRFYGIDLTYMSDALRAFLIGFQLRIQEANEKAAVPNPDLMFDIRGMDENQGLWEYLTAFARPMARALKFKRGDSSSIIQLTQGPQDYEAVGAAGSQSRQLAVNSAKDIGVFVIGHLESPDSVEYTAHMLDLSPFEAHVIHTLERGQYGVKFPGRAMEFFQMRYTPVRKFLVETNMAMSEAIASRRVLQ